MTVVELSTERAVCKRNVCEWRENEKERERETWQLDEARRGEAREERRESGCPL